jgi:hypothetical protein
MCQRGCEREWSPAAMPSRGANRPHARDRPATQHSTWRSVSSSAGCRSRQRGPNRHQIFHVIILTRPLTTDSMRSLSNLTASCHI